MIDKKHCNGCRDNFYNGNNPLNVKECWSLKTAQLVTRWRTGTWTMPATPGAFTEVRVPHCYHAQGYSFTDKLPAFAIDPVRLRAVETTKERGRGGVL